MLKQMYFQNYPLTRLVGFSSAIIVQPTFSLLSGNAFEAQNRFFWTCSMVPISLLGILIGLEEVFKSFSKPSLVNKMGTQMHSFLLNSTSTSLSAWNLHIFFWLGLGESLVDIDSVWRHFPLNYLFFVPLTVKAITTALGTLRFSSVMGGG